MAKQKKPAEKPKQKAVLREGAPAATAFETAMRQILNPLPSSSKKAS